MTPEEVKALIDLGMQGIGLYLLIQVWQRLNVVTDRMLTYLEAAAKERQQLLKAAGVEDDETKRST